MNNINLDNMNKLKVSQGKTDARYISVNDIKKSMNIFVYNHRTKNTYTLSIKKNPKTEGSFTITGDDKKKTSISLLNNSTPKVMLIDSTIISFYISNRNILYIVSSDVNDFFKQE